MNNNLFKNLKELQSIQPNREFSKKSRFLILSSKPQINIDPTQTQIYAGGKRWTYTEIKNVLNWMSLHKLATAASVIGVFIFLVYLTVSYLPGNQNSLVAEANEINSSIQIKLNEIQYYLNNEQAINSETASNLQSLLQDAAKELTIAKDLSADSSKIKESLEKIKAAEQILLQINSLLQNQK